MLKYSTKRSNTKEFIEKAQEVHGDKYDYSEVDYINNHTKVKIKCNKCNKYFLQTPHAHLRGQGCITCATEKTYQSQRITLQEFIKKAKNIHKDAYDYSKVKYISMHKKVIIICNRCKKEFLQSPNHHLKGQGCTHCRLQRQKENNLKKYGVENVFASEHVKQKMKQTCLKKYGVLYVQQSQEFINKVWQSKKRHNTVNTSKPEQKIKQLLLTKFKEIKYQYKSKLYPFYCDFYIPKLDLYIEYQGYPGHGKKPYDPNDLNDIKRTKIWLARAILNELKTHKRSGYRDYIKTWTIRDPLKRETARKNNLNWLEFFTMDQFMKWYNSI